MALVVKDFTFVVHFRNMRKAFSKEIERIALEDERVVFITGDLGFDAFESLQKSLGDRFINAGVAEQHMIGMAAGLASKGHRVIVYSIAPFLVYRALEQIRNDVCFHSLPVCIVGNGGGYGYGIMGSSHHALNDVGILSGLPEIKIYTPAFDSDIPLHLSEIFNSSRPSYLRLGYSTTPIESKSFEPARIIHLGKNPKVTMAFMGPIINEILQHPKWDEIKDDIELFSFQQFPIIELNATMETSLKRTKQLICVEEHVEAGGLAQQLSLAIHKANLTLENFLSKHALGYPDNKYGSQSFHQEQSGLNAVQLIQDIKNMTRNG